MNTTNQANRSVLKPVFQGVYAITSDSLLPEDVLLERIDAVLAEGISLLQFRSKSGNSEQRMRIAERVKTCCDNYSVPLLINDDCQLCQALGAAGVHLGQSDLPLTEARNLLGDSAIIGVTCHDSIAAAMHGQENGANYAAFGRFFPSNTKPNAPQADLSILEQAKTGVNLPVVAIGGINEENGARAIAAGADMLAVIDYLFGASTTSESAERARSLVHLFDTAG